MTDESRLAALENRIQENRDRSDDQIESVYKRIDEKLEPTERWYEVRWVRRMIVGLVIWGVLVVTGVMLAQGVLPEGYFRDLVDLAGEVKEVSEL